MLEGNDDETRPRFDARLRERVSELSNGALIGPNGEHQGQQGQADDDNYGLHQDFFLSTKPNGNNITDYDNSWYQSMKSSYPSLEQQQQQQQQQQDYNMNLSDSSELLQHYKNQLHARQQSQTHQQEKQQGQSDQGSSNLELEKGNQSTGTDTRASETALLNKRAAVIASMAQKGDSESQSSSVNDTGEQRGGRKGGAQSNTVSNKPASVQRRNTAIDVMEKSDQLSSATSNPNSVARHNSDQSEIGQGVSLSNSQKDATPRKRASTADIDGLLAEGKAAAIGSFAHGDKNSSGYSKPVSRAYSSQAKAGRKDIPPAAAAANFKNKKTEGLENNKKDLVNTVGVNGESSACKSESRESEQKRPDSHRQSTSSSYPERRLYEPPRINTVVAHDDNHPSAQHSSTHSKQSNKNHTRPLNSSHLPTPSKPEMDHEFLHLQPDEVEQLRDWLNVTRYHDEEYRRKTIHRHKRLAALEQEKADLLREEQNERDAMTSWGDIGHSSFTPAIPMDTTLRTSSSAQPTWTPPVSAMQAPSDSKRDDLSEATAEVNGHKDHNAIGNTNRPPPANNINPSSQPSLKRENSGTITQRGQAERSKVARTDRSGYQASSRYEDEDHDDFPRAQREYRRYRSPLGNCDEPMKEDRDGPVRYGAHRGSPQPSGEFQWYKHRNTRGRGGSYRGSYVGTRGSRIPNHSRTISSPGPLRLDLEYGKVAFFMIKSMDYENVDASQRDGVWMTQHKNVESLTEAFETYRDVILFFSVNTSKAFQGYARMECVPGDDNVPHPQWTRKLGFQNNPPFKVNWINTTETKFRYVGHLKNSYNEDAPVLVGRDGQSIEPQCGIDLCSVIDDLANHP